MMNGRKNMVSYKVVEKDGDIWTYEYLPECEYRPGYIKYNIKTGERILEDIQWSPDDLGHTYGFHVWGVLDNHYETDNIYPEEGKVAWY